jgi:hypothetical protein
VIFLGGVGVRKIIHKGRVRRKMKKLLKKPRGGGGSADGSKILQYESEGKELMVYTPLLFSHLFLSAKEKLVKSIVQKCLRSGKMYKITHQNLLELIDLMFKFPKKSKLKVIR